MHWSGFTSTMPFAYWTMRARAPGRPRGSPGSAQCMHWSLRMSHLMPPSTSFSSKRIRFQNSASSVWQRLVVAVVNWFSTMPEVVPLLAGDLARLAADAGGGVDELRDGRGGSAAGARCPRPARTSGRSRGSVRSWPPPHSLLDLHEEGLVLGSPGVRVHGRRASGSSRAGRCGRGCPRSPSGSASRSARRSCRPPSTAADRFVTIAIAVIEPRATDTLIIAPFAMPCSFASSSGISKKKSGCTIVQPRVVLGPVVEVLGEAVRRADDRVLVLLAVDVSLSEENLLRDGIRRHLRVERRSSIGASTAS